MIRYHYHVFLGTKHIDMVYAFNGEHAVQIVESKFGPAKRLSKDNYYRAVRA